MKLAGSQFSKISGTKNPDFNGKLEVSSNIQIKKIDKFKSDLAKQNTLEIEYVFDIDYKDLGKIQIQGKLFFITDSKTQKEIISQHKNKKLDQEYQVFLLNTIIQKASLKAFQLEEELNLPLHLQLARFTPQEKK